MVEMSDDIGGEGTTGVREDGVIGTEGAEVFEQDGGDGFSCVISNWVGLGKFCVKLNE